MKSIQITGKTVDDAIKNALGQLNVTIDKVEIKVIEEGSKGLFKIIGAKPAKIEATVKRDLHSEVKEFLNKIFKTMNLEPNIIIKEENNVLKISLSGKDMGTIIGYRGHTLDSLQYILSLVVNKDNDEKYKRVELDTENYRSKREETLKRLADNTADKVKFLKKTYKLEPMNPYERRIIHSRLQDNPYVETFSEGEEPYRRVVVALK